MSNIQSNSRCTLVAVLVFVAVSFLSVTPLWADNITYNLVSYPAYQNGYDLEGSITTDGTIGTIESFRQLSFQLTEPFTASTVAGDHQLNLDGTLEATATQLILLVNSQLFLLSDGDTGEIVYSNFGPNISEYSAQYGGTSIWFEVGSSYLPPAFTPDQPWVIATAVPEPTSLTLLGTALLGLGVASCVRRRRRAA
jgi:hypothetical protein